MLSIKIELSSNASNAEEMTSSNNRSPHYEPINLNKDALLQDHQAACNVQECVEVYCCNVENRSHGRTKGSSIKKKTLLPGMLI